MSVQVANSGAASYDALALSDPSFDDFRPWSQTSGAPSELTIHIKKMVLRGLDSTVKDRVIFEDTTGKPIAIEGSYIDLSALFTEFACINSSGELVDFEDKTPETMDFDISMAHTVASDRTETLDVNYPITDNVSITTSSAVRMTLVIDANRVLRFYNQGRSDSSGPNLALPITRSYFYTTVFAQSSFVFVGKPGDIKGYAFVTKARSSASTIPTNHECTNNPFVVAGWMTLIYDKDGKPMAVNLMPDDDATLTVLKGGNNSRNGLNSSAFTVKTGKVDFAFNLGESDIGHVYNLNTNLAVGTTDNTAYFEGLQSSYGILIVKRGL